MRAKSLRQFQYRFRQGSTHMRAILVSHVLAKFSDRLMLEATINGRP
jgi:hypothetical protein